MSCIIEIQTTLQEKGEGIKSALVSLEDFICSPFFLQNR